VSRTPQATLSQNIRWNNIHGVMTVLSMNMVMPFAGLFAIRLGATDAQLAALSSWPALAGLIAMIPGARMVDKQQYKKRMVVFFQLFTRSFYLLLALLPLLVANEGYPPAVFVTMIALMNLPGAVANVSWQSFIGGVIPAEQRAQAFAVRNQLMAVCGAAATLLAGRVMGSLSFPVGFQVMFFIGFALALGERHALLKIEETPGSAAAERKSVQGRTSLREMVGRMGEHPQTGALLWPHWYFISAGRWPGRSLPSFRCRSFTPLPSGSAFSRCVQLWGLPLRIPSGRAIQPGRETSSC
jgi:hypothetical protein